LEDENFIDFSAFSSGVKVLESFVDVPVISEWKREYLTMR